MQSLKKWLQIIRFFIYPWFIHSAQVKETNKDKTKQISKIQILKITKNVITNIIYHLLYINKYLNLTDSVKRIGKTLKYW